MRQSQNIWQWEKTNGVNRLLRNANNFTFFLKSFVPSLFCTFYFEVVPILFFFWIVIEELSSIRSWTIIYALLNLSRSIYFQFSTNIYNVFRNSLICFSVFAIHDRKKIYLYTLYICGHYQHLPEVRRLGVDSWDEQICVVFLVFF